MRFDITIHPELLSGAFSHGILQRAQSFECVQCTLATVAASASRGLFA